MSAVPRRVPPTEGTVVTTPLGARHWSAFAAALLLGAGAWWLAAERVGAWLAPAAIPRWAIASPTDARGWAAALATSRLRAEAGVIVLGSSVTRQALWPEDRLARAAPAAGAGRARFVVLAANTQAFMEDLFLLTRAPLRADRLVVVVTSPTRFAFSEPRLGGRLDDGGWLASPAGFATRFAGELPELSALLEPALRRRAALAVQRQLLYRGIRGGVARWFAVHVYGDTAIRYRRYELDDEPVGDVRVQDRHRLELQRDLAPRFEAQVRANVRRLAAAVRFVRASGAHLVLLEAPRIPGDERRTYGFVWRRYQRVLRLFADSAGVGYVDFADSLALGPELFHDARHLGPSGRDRWSAAFLRQVAAWCHDPRLRPIAGCA